MKEFLKGKRIVLGVCGSIAAYKSAELVRALQTEGADVRVVMTSSAKDFITPLTLQALSKHPVRSDMSDPVAEATMSHIDLARWADLVLVAPATQDFLARLVIGRADDLLTAICSVAEVPLAIAPAMNHSMWSNAATQENVTRLQGQGVVFLGPDYGDQACGETGAGRMREVDAIVSDIRDLFRTGILAGLTVLVTAGPTREAIDPVRYISNRSSGKMGYAIAMAAHEAGAHVILVSGPVSLEAPDGVELVKVISAEQMYEQVMQRLEEVDVFIGAAAVSDYRPVASALEKIKKDQSSLDLHLEKTPDIIAAVSQAAEKNISNDGRRKPFTVGFAAETQNLDTYARSKLERKQLDMVAANLVGDNLGFEQDNNALEVFWTSGHQSLPMMPKSGLARHLVTIIAERFHANCTTEDT